MSLDLSAITTVVDALKTASSGKRIAIVLTLLVAACLGSAWVGYDYGTSKGKAETEKVKKEGAQAALQAQAAAHAQYVQENDRANAAERALVLARKQLAKERQDFKRRIFDVSTVYQPSPGAAPVALPRSVFTVGWLQLYNAAIGLSEVRTPAAPGSVGDTAGTGATANAWLRDAGLNQADILAHIADYGERCRGIETQLNKLIDLHEGKNEP